jgi:hypothetical protein
MEKYFENALHHGSIRDAMIKTKNEFDLDSNFSLELKIKVNFGDLDVPEGPQCPNNSPCDTDSAYNSADNNSPCISDTSN